MVEIRRYFAFPGRRDELADYMDRVVIPFHREKGVEVSASLLDREDDDAYIWIRQFDDVEDSEQKYHAIYEDPIWIETMAPIVTQLMDPQRSVITLTKHTQITADQ